MYTFLFWKQGLPSYVAQVDLKLMTPLPELYKCWDYRLVPPSLSSFYIFKWLKEKSEEYFVLHRNYIKKLQSFINSYPHLFVYVLSMAAFNTMTDKPNILVDSMGSAKYKTFIIHIFRKYL